MFRAAVAFFLLAILAFVFGAYGIAGLSIDIGRMLLVIFLVLSVISFLVSMVTGGKLNKRY